LNRLLTIPISHYCERARWALERAGVLFVEEQHLQIFHYLATRRAGAGATVPVLVTASGTVLGESRAIVRWAESHAPAAARWTPPGAKARAEAEALSDRFESDLGVESRRLVYPRAMRLPREAMRTNGGTAPPFQRRAFELLLPFAKVFISRRLDLSAPALARAEASVRRTFDEVARRIADGREHLVGDRFSGADLDFAVFAAPVVLPPEYGVELPPIEAFAPEDRALLDELRTHPAGRFALSIYRRHRRVVTASSDSG
jgi:glutathione S-transferase